MIIRNDHFWELTPAEEAAMEVWQRGSADTTGMLCSVRAALRKTRADRDADLTAGQIDATEDVDYWPTPYWSTYEAALRATLPFLDPPMPEDEVQVRLADAFEDPAFCAFVEAVWKDRLPTPDSYFRACRALEKHRERANEAEVRLAKVRTLCEAARYALGVGCLSSVEDDDGGAVCDGSCGGHRTTGWTLDPAEVLAILGGAEG